MLKNLLTTYDYKSAETPNGLQYDETPNGINQ